MRGKISRGSKKHGKDILDVRLTGWNKKSKVDAGKKSFANIRLNKQDMKLIKAKYAYI